MKKLKIKVNLEKYDLKNKLILIVLLIDVCILIWIVFDIVKLPIYDLIVIAVVLNAIFVLLYNRYSDIKEKNNNEKVQVEKSKSK